MLGVDTVSDFLEAVAAEPRLELGPEGGGDFSRGDVGQCGVLSPLPPALFGGRGSLEAASPAWRVGTLAADRALCIAAADGCVEIGVDNGAGRLSLRVGEAFRDVRGLEAGDGDDMGPKLPDGCFFNGGAATVVAGVADGFRDSLLGLLRSADVFAAALPFSIDVSA